MWSMTQSLISAVYFLTIFQINAKPLQLQHFLKPALTNMATLTPTGTGLTLDPPKNSIGPGTELTVVIRGLDPTDGSTFMIQVVINLAQLLSTCNFYAKLSQQRFWT